MSGIRSCRYRECYHNHNFEHRCLTDKVTVSATGECENLMHCDEFSCPDCDMREVCDKPRKHEEDNR